MNIDYEKRIFGLDLMRAIAILGVLGSHALWVYSDSTGILIDLLHFGGIMGVEIFFVLSGFLIGRILYKIFIKEDFKTADLGYFLVRRWLRTLPNYYLILLLNILLITAMGRQLPESLGLYFGFLQNLYFRMDIFFTETWSLPVEEFAYILGPLLLYVGMFVFGSRLPRKKVTQKQLFLGVTLLIIAFFLCSKIIYATKVPDLSLEYWNEELKAVVLYRIDAIYYGVLAAFIAMNYPAKWAVYKQLSAFLGAFIFVGFHGTLAYFQWTTESTPWIWNVLYLPLSSICIAFFLPWLSTWESTAKWLLVPVTYLSVISYAVYLLHYGIILQGMRWLFTVEAFSANGKAIFTISYLAVTLIISYFWFRFYEKPMMDLRDLPSIKNRFGA